MAACWSRCLPGLVGCRRPPGRPWLGWLHLCSTHPPLTHPRVLLCVAAASCACTCPTRWTQTMGEHAGTQPRRRWRSRCPSCGKTPSSRRGARDRGPQTSWLTWRTAAHAEHLRPIALHSWAFMLFSRHPGRASSKQAHVPNSLRAPRADRCNPVPHSKPTRTMLASMPARGTCAIARRPARTGVAVSGRRVGLRVRAYKDDNGKKPVEPEKESRNEQMIDRLKAKGISPGKARELLQVLRSVLRLPGCGRPGRRCRVRAAGRSGTAHAPPRSLWSLRRLGPRWAPRTPRRSGSCWSAAASSPCARLARSACWT